jgi:aspartate/methionine/tyrosine aminotransferase
MFSRFASDLHADTNPLYLLHERLKSEGCRVSDFISGNVNDQGILFPKATLEQILLRAARASQIYNPDPAGRPSAREAISAYYLTRGLVIPPESIIVTPGTSISYWYCFKLLADEGEEVLCPRPSYPLFDYIAGLCGIQVVHYPLDEQRGWALDLAGLENRISTKTRALVLISPHNPTGHIASAAEVHGLAELADRHNLAIISDEVFGDFLLTQDSLPRPATGEAPLVLTLNGFSKMFALPGMKFGWTAVTGRQERVRPALRALELISDTFLPVNETVQAAAPEIFHLGESFQKTFRDELSGRYRLFRELLGGCPCIEYVEPNGGFYLILKLLSGNEDRASQKILEDAHTLVHPGHFYDLEGDHLILSYVQQPDVIRSALPRLLAVLENLS